MKGFAVLAIAALLSTSTRSEAKNMFYVLAASWCDQGGHKPKRFEITDDGSLIYDWSKGRVCQIKSATNMHQPVGDYIVTWRCETGEVKEKLSTFVLPGKNGGRRFLLTREKIPHRGKAETFEQCSEGGEAMPRNLVLAERIIFPEYDTDNRLAR